MRNHGPPTAMAGRGGMVAVRWWWLAAAETPPLVREFIVCDMWVPPCLIWPPDCPPRPYLPPTASVPAMPAPTAARTTTHAPAAVPQFHVRCECLRRCVRCVRCHNRSRCHRYSCRVGAIAHAGTVHPSGWAWLTEHLLYKHTQPSLRATSPRPHVLVVVCVHRASRSSPPSGTNTRPPFSTFPRPQRHVSGATPLPHMLGIMPAPRVRRQAPATCLAAAADDVCCSPNFACSRRWSALRLCVSRDNRGSSGGATR